MNELKRYMVIVDQRFRRAAIGELRTILPGAELQLNRRFGGEIIMVLATKKSTKELAKALDARARIFTDLIIQLDSVIKKEGSPYDGVLDNLSKILKANNLPFMIEVKVLNAELQERAKAIEVSLGNRLEACGFVADLRNPKIMLYVVFMPDRIMIGHTAGMAGTNGTLDYFRSANKDIAETLNRAEFKIREAIDFFGIDPSKVKTALDIGAAPGGWTHCLSKLGARVIAVDNGLLDYCKLVDSGKVLILADADEVHELSNFIDSEGLKGKVAVELIDSDDIDFKGYRIVHIKAHLKPSESVKVLERFGKFDLLMIDTNTPSDVSAGIADSLAGLLNAGAGLVMTTKLTTMLIDEHVRVAKEELSKHYHGIRVKKLPHNRRELTIYAVLGKSRK